MSARATHRMGSRDNAIGIVAGTFLFLFFLGGAAYLILVGNDRSDLQIVTGEIQTKKWRGARLLGGHHVEFDTEVRHLYYGGPAQKRIGSHLEPGMRITALVHPHAYRNGILVVEELTADGELLITHEERRRFYRRFGYVAFVFSLISFVYALYCWRSTRMRKSAT